MANLPPNQSAIMSGGYSPWQAPLAALFSGISAAAQPGGFANFGQGVQQGQQNFQQGQQQQQMMDLRRMQMEQAQEEMRRANQEREQEQALIANLRNLGGAPGSPTPVQHVGNYGAATGGIQTASGTPMAAMFGGNQQLAAIYDGLLDAGDVKGALGLAAEYATQEPAAPEAPKTVGGMFWDGDSFEAIPGYTDQQAAIASAGRAEAPAPATNLITLVAPDGKTTRSYDSRDPRVKQLAEDGWVERDRSLFPAPPIGYQPAAGGSGVEPIPGGPADPNRQTETQRNEFKKQSLALDNLETALSDYESALDKYGSTETYGEGKGVLENAYANVLIQAKEAAALGALTGPDMDIMNQTVVAPNSMGQLMVGGASGVKTQIGSFRGQLKQKRGNLNKLYSPGSGDAGEGEWTVINGVKIRRKN
jgi:hypothetical protein